MDSGLALFTLTETWEFSNGKATKNRGHGTDRQCNKKNTVNWLNSDASLGLSMLCVYDAVRVRCCVLYGSAHWQHIKTDKLMLYRVQVDSIEISVSFRRGVIYSPEF